MGLHTEEWRLIRFANSLYQLWTAVVAKRSRECAIDLKSPHQNHKTIRDAKLAITTWPAVSQRQLLLEMQILQLAVK